MPQSLLNRREAVQLLGAAAAAQALAAEASDICFLSALEMAALIRRKKLSARFQSLDRGRPWQNRDKTRAVELTWVGFEHDLPAGDRLTLDGYLEDVREIERRIENAEQQAPAGMQLTEAPVGIPESFDEHFKIMFDLQVLAFRAEITRVATLMYARDTSGAVYPQSGSARASTLRRIIPITAPTGSLCLDQQVSRTDAGVFPR